MRIKTSITQKFGAQCNLGCERKKRIRTMVFEVQSAKLRTHPSAVKYAAATPSMIQGMCYENVGRIYRREATRLSARYR